MAEIATYMCSNALCKMQMLLSRDFPIWAPETPVHLKTLMLSDKHTPYLLGLHSDLFCHHCKKVFGSLGTLLCPFCKAEDVRNEHVGETCPRCSAGTFTLASLSVY